MGKKKTKTAPAARPKRVARRLDELRERTPAEVERFFEEAPLGELRELLEEGFLADLVNFLLDLKKSAVKTFFERVLEGRKRIATPPLTLYQYKLYLTNPLPLTVTGTNGEDIPNYYAVLGVSRDATAEDLDEAQKLLTRAFAAESFAPDDRATAAERFQEIEEAAAILCNPKRRQEADALLPNINYLYPRRDNTWLEAVRRFLG